MIFDLVCNRSINHRPMVQVPGSIPTGCNILFFHVVKPLRPILPIASSLWKTLLHILEENQPFSFGSVLCLCPLTWSNIQIEIIWRVTHTIARYTAFVLFHTTVSYEFWEFYLTNWRILTAWTRIWTHRRSFLARKGRAISGAYVTFRALYWSRFMQWHKSKLM